MSKITWFLVVYDSDSRSLVEEVEEYDDAQEAHESYFSKEGEYAARPAVEVVLLGSESIEDVKVTHSRYFGEIADYEGFNPRDISKAAMSGVLRIA